MGIECKYRSPTHKCATTNAPGPARRTSKPAHAHGQKQSTRTARRHMHTTSKNKSHTCASRGGGAKAARRRRNWPWDWVTLAPQNLHSKGRGQREACKGVQREGGCSPAPGRCRRWSTRHAHTGGLMPPCSRSDRRQGTSGRGGRSQAGPERPLRSVCVSKVGGRVFRASGGT